MRLTRTLVLLAALTACDAPPAEPPPPPQPTPPVVEAPKPAVAPLSAGELAAAEPVALVPSPLEMQAALKRSGLLGPQGLLVKPRPLKAAGEDHDRLAVRTGVALADLLLIVQTAQTPELVALLKEIRGGLVALGAKDDALRALDELTARVQNEALTRDALVQELDTLSGSTLPELEAQIGPRAVPLIRAGSWLEGANLVSSSIIAGGNYDTATDLLRHPGVVAWFQRYVEETPAERPDQEQLVPILRESLKTLAAATAAERLGEPEVRQIHQSTAAVLDLL